MSAGTLATVPGWQLAEAAALYSFYLYWDFAGYSQMAIGLGKFWGITLPENFRWPFLARNLAEFWKRWHITLSEFLRDYLFYPLSLALKRRAFFKKNLLLAAALPPLVTFLLAGIWHGAGVGFLLFGLLHGVGLGWLAVLQRITAKKKSARMWGESAVGHAIGALVTFAYVTLTFVLFALPAEKLLVLWERFSPFAAAIPD